MKNQNLVHRFASNFLSYYFLVFIKKAFCPTPTASVREFEEIKISQLVIFWLFLNKSTPVTFAFITFLFVGQRSGSCPLSIKTLRIFIRNSNSNGVLGVF